MVKIDLSIPKYFHKLGAKAQKSFSIQGKIIGIVAVAVFIPMLISTYLSGVIVAEKIESGFKTRVLDNLQATSYYFDDYQKKARDNASMLSRVTELRQYAEVGDSLKASQLVVPLASEIGLDLVVLVDKDRKLLARTDQPSRQGEDLSGDFLVKSGFAGYKTIAVEAAEKGLAIKSVAPIKADISATGVQSIGVIITQYNLDKRFVNNIKKMNGVEATLYVKDNIISTMLEEKGSSLESIKDSLSIDSKLKSRLMAGQSPQFEKKKINGKYYSIAYKILTDNKNQPIAIISVALSQQAVTKAKTVTQLNLIIIGLIGIAFAVLFGVITSKGIVRPINRLIKDTKIIAEGKLTYKTQINGNDEVGQLAKAFNQMADSLRVLVSQISDTVNETAAAGSELNDCVDRVNEVASQVQKTSEELRTGSGQQVLQLSSTKEKIDRVAFTARDIMEQTESIASYTNKAKAIVYEGDQSMRKLIGKVGGTKHSMEQMAAKIKGFRSNLQQIGKMTDIIKDIENQTKLLALNAAIEAARAGESGRGFSVVAAEIKQLSDRSSDSVNSIKDVVKQLFAEMETTMQVVGKSVDEVDDICKIADNTGAAFGNIVQTIDGVNAMITDISVKSSLQTSNTEEITALIYQISDISQNSFSEAELLLEGSESQTKSLERVLEELERMMESMSKANGLVSRFNI